jgi:hypothetical protein
MFGSVLRFGVAMIGVAAAGQALAAAPHPVLSARPAMAAAVGHGPAPAKVPEPANRTIILISLAAIAVASRTDMRKFARVTV